MKKNDINELRKKELKELEKVLSDKKLEYIKAKTNIKATKEKNLKKSKNIKREVAMISTLIKEKEFMMQMKKEE
jgi:ribosomal protein L29